MHRTAKKYAQLFFDIYSKDFSSGVVVDIGALNVNGSIKDVCPTSLKYVGVDFIVGKGVDVVLKDPYALPFDDESIDIVCCSSCFEHSEFFWLLFLEISRILKPNGLLYLNVPSNGAFHQYPVDCWRFYPDSGHALAAWGRREGYPITLLESFIGEQSESDINYCAAWFDFIAVFAKGIEPINSYTCRMIDALDDYSNGFSSYSGLKSKSCVLGPDQRKVSELIDKVVRRDREITRLKEIISGQVPTNTHKTDFDEPEVKDETTGDSAAGSDPFSVNNQPYPFYDKTYLTYGEGCHPSEGSMRWLGRSAQVTVPADQFPASIIIQLSCAAAEYYGVFPFATAVYAGNQLLAWMEFERGGQQHTRLFTVPPSESDIEINIVSEASFTPSECGLSSDDARDLSVELLTIRSASDSDQQEYHSGLDDLVLHAKQAKYNGMQTTSICWIKKHHGELLSENAVFRELMENVFLVNFENGCYPLEQNYRWLAQTARLSILAGQSVNTIIVEISCYSSDVYPVFPFATVICSGDNILGWMVFEHSGQLHTRTLALPRSESDLEIIIESETCFKPSESSLSDDTRELAVQLVSIRVAQEQDRSESHPILEDLISSAQMAIDSGMPANAIRWLKRGSYLFPMYRAFREFITRINIFMEVSSPTGAHTQVAQLYETEYDRWMKRHGLNIETLRTSAVNLKYKPLVSVLTPVYNVDPYWLYCCVHSVLCQVYQNWELHLVDDGSSRQDTLAALKKWANADSRIHVHYVAQNQGIAAATNRALDASRGEFIALLDNDDELSPDALYEVAALLNREPELDFIYSDEDKLDFSGRRCEPFFKPDWSPELLRSYAYTCHLSVYRTVLARQLTFRSAFDGAQDYDFTLRVSERTQQIGHIPKILYHWRKIPGSAADTIDAKSWALKAAECALADHAKRMFPGSEVYSAPGAPGCFRIKHALPHHPLVSILIPTRGQITPDNSQELLYHCIRSIEARTEYSNYEIIIAYNNAMDPEIEAFFRGRPYTLLNYELSGPFNFARKLNFMARQANGEHLVIFNDDLEVITPGWLTSLLEFSQQPDIGAVGSRLLFPDNTLQHVGMVLGINGYPAHVFYREPAENAGYMAHANLIRNYSVVTGAAMMIRTEVFRAIGGMDETFAIDYNDTDLCLKVRQKGYRVVYMPYSELYHHEGKAISSNRLRDEETSEFHRRWGAILECDPYYNPNLTRTRLDYSLGE